MIYNVEIFYGTKVGEKEFKSPNKIESINCEKHTPTTIKWGGIEYTKCSKCNVLLSKIKTN